MKLVEYWRWRYRDAQTGRVYRTTFQLTAEEAAKYPAAERIEGSMSLRETEDDFVVTRPMFGPAQVALIGKCSAAEGQRRAML